MASGTIKRPSGYPQTTVVPVLPNQNGVYCAMSKPEFATGGTVRKLSFLGISPVTVTLNVNLTSDGGAFLDGTNHITNIRKYSTLAVVDWTY